MNNVYSTRDKSILIGLYLSRFDEKALTILGFKGFNEAFNILGLSIGTKPASLKNYRDEFDPLFPNPRKGWHKRVVREYCKTFYNEYANFTFNTFTELIKSFVLPNYDIERIVKSEKDMSETVAKRLLTGKAAEEYFKINYTIIPIFKGFNLQDTTNLACGFDFKLSLNVDYFCIEVKGLNSNSGSIAMTEKEYHVANKLKNKYCLFIVKNFADTPNHQYYIDPLNSKLSFKKTEKKIIQINYSAQI